MEVTCKKCNAEYDFDDSLVGDSGTTVKCTDCGHVFKVFPSSSGGTRPALQVRFRDGHVERLSSLRDLQRRAREGSVSLDDELGREGFGWRALRDVPELRGFFPTASRTPSGQVPRAAPGTHALTVTPSMQPGESATPQPQASPQRTILGMGSPLLGAPPAPGAATQRQGSPTSPPAKVPAPAAAAPASRSAASSRPASRHVAPPPAAATPASPKLYLAEDDVPDIRPTPQPGGAGGLRWIGVAVLVAGGAWLGVSAMSGDSPISGSSELSPGEPPQAGDDTESPEAGALAEAEAPAVEPLNAEPSEPAEADAKVAQPAAEEPDEAPAAPTSARPRERAKPAAGDGPGKDDYSSLVARGDRFLEARQFAKAEAAYKQAIERRAGGSEAHSGLGFALLGQGKTAAAITSLERAASGGFAPAHVGLGDALAKLGRGGEAVDAYEAYLQRLPSGSKASYARERIRALKSSGKTAPPQGELAPEPAADEPAPAALPEEPPQPDDGEPYVPAGAIPEGSP